MPFRSWALHKGTYWPIMVLHQAARAVLAWDVEDGAALFGAAAASVLGRQNDVGALATGDARLRRTHIPLGRLVQHTRGQRCARRACAAVVHGASRPYAMASCCTAGAVPGTQRPAALSSVRCMPHPASRSPAPAGRRLAGTGAWLPESTPLRAVRRAAGLAG